MKNLSFIIFLLVLSISSINAQNITISDLQTMTSQKDWSKVNQYLINKNWEFYDSEKGDRKTYSTIIWSYLKSSYNDKAQGWLSLIAEEGYSNQVSYQCFNKEGYDRIYNSLSSYGYTLNDSEIEDGMLVFSYANSSYILTIVTAKREDDDSFSDNTFDSYMVTMYEKGGIHDEDNGIRRTYSNTGQLEIEYSLRDGIIDGIFKVYYDNGKLKKEGYYSNGLENGAFKEYDEFGNISASYMKRNGEVEGLMTIYENGKKVFEKPYVDGKVNGIFRSYNELGQLEVEANIFQDSLHGIYTIYDGNNVKVRQNYVNGMLHGEQRQYKDGQIEMIQNYQNDNLHGECTKYEDGKVTLIENYQNGKLHGSYTEYSYENLDLVSIVYKTTGGYQNNKMHGKWMLETYEENSRDIEVIQFGHFKNGEKYGSFKEIEGDSLIYCNYIDDQLHGKYEVYFDIFYSLFGIQSSTDSSNYSKLCDGYYINGKTTGTWNFYFNGVLNESGKLINNKREGTWKAYQELFKSDLKDGEFNASIVTGSSTKKGRLLSTTSYLNDKKNGKREVFEIFNTTKIPCKAKDKNIETDSCYYEEYVKLYMLYNFKDDKAHGEFIFKDSTGALLQKGYYKNDKKHGKWITNYQDGTGVEQTYSYDKPKGAYKKTENGILREKGEVDGEEMIGDWFFYTKTGKLLQKENYSYQGKIRRVEFYNPEGFISGSRDFDRYENTEKITKYLDNVDGEVVSELEVLKKNGNTYKLKVLVNDTDTIFENHYTLKTNKELEYFSFVDGVKDGQAKKTVRKRVIEEGQYENNRKIGNWTYYHYDKVIKVNLQHYNNGTTSPGVFTSLIGTPFTGTFNYYYKTGELKEEVTVKEGKRHGKTTHYSKSGEIINKEKYKEGVLKD